MLVYPTQTYVTQCLQNIVSAILRRRAQKWVLNSWSFQPEYGNVTITYIIKIQLRASLVSELWSQGTAVKVQLRVRRSFLNWVLERLNWGK